MPRGAEPIPLSKGETTRRAVLQEAMQLASVQGLEGLSIGQLAEATGMSKAGLFAHFGSKEELQVATIQAARAFFTSQVFGPALKAPRGLPRLCAVLAAWLDYAEGEFFRGGCFFAQVSTEFDSRPGPVKALVAGCMKEWLASLERLVADAREEGHLSKSADPGQLAFEFLALAMGANNSFQLHGDAAAFGRARKAIRDRLRTYAPGARLHPL
ncbi:MAG TPA: TetR/AcrR family transcriptional regulator [Holophagaceae bacterium]|nr:TetR/AcrR family transcriptional regulator [Holophagaceae bacterium]